MAHYHIEISQGLRVDDLPALQKKVRLHGGRLVAYAEVVSLLVLSARSYQVKWIETVYDRKRAGIWSTIISGTLGWWSIVGPYRTITAFVWNARGGIDVTEALLRAHPGNPSLLGYAEESALKAFHEGACRAALRACVMLVIFVIGGLGCLIWSASSK